MCTEYTIQVLSFDIISDELSHQKMLHNFYYLFEDSLNILTIYFNVMKYKEY